MFSKFAQWLGLTLVILFFLQMVIVFSGGPLADAGFQELFFERLISQAPMAFVGLLFMSFNRKHYSSIKDNTFFNWIICLIASFFCFVLVVVIPMTVAGNYNFSNQANQSLNQRKLQLQLAHKQSQTPAVQEVVIEQLVKKGQLSSNATGEEKEAASREFMNRQLSYLSREITKAEAQTRFAVNQRWLGGTFSALVLFVAFLLLAFTAVL